jgi:hypothetical protein
VTAPRSGARRTLAELRVPSEPGNERRAMEEGVMYGKQAALLRYAR